MNYIESLRKELESAAKSVPEDFYATFNFTQTGNNLSHPVTLGFIVAAVWKMKDVSFVGVDVRLNEGGARFTPDVVGFSSVEENKPVIVVDYESPNSSDMRVPQKDVAAFHAWSRETGYVGPYVIITTLPEGPADDWELRYSSKNYVNEAVHGRRSEIRKSPKKFWYKIYGQKIPKPLLKNVHFLNISGNKVSNVTVGR